MYANKNVQIFSTDICYIIARLDAIYNGCLCANVGWIPGLYNRLSDLFVFPY